MERKTKSTVTHTPESSFMKLLSGWVQQGVESFFATQRILVELATQQNSHAVKMVKSHLFSADMAPRTVLTELAGEGTTNFIEAQKVLLAMAQKQNELIMTGIKEHVDTSLVPAMTEMVRRSVDTFIGMQERFLHMAEKQTGALFECARTGKPFKGDGLFTMAREAMDTFVETQKKFLDVVAEETANAADGKYAAMKKGKKTEFVKLAQQATESFVDAQKKLLDLATRQMGANLKAAGHAANMLPTFSLAPFTELTKDVVKSYVEAHKALLDVMVKPLHKTEHPARPMTAPKRTSRVRPMMKAATA